MVATFFGEHVDDGQSEQRQGDEREADGNLDAANTEIERHTATRAYRAFETQHEHGKPFMAKLQTTPNA